MIVWDTSSIVGVAYLIYSATKVVTYIYSNISRPLNIIKSINFYCAKCISFWAVLLSTGDIITASLVSLSVLLMDSFIYTKL